MTTPETQHDDIESVLLKQHLQRPSIDLDRRLAQSLSAAEAGGPAVARLGFTTLLGSALAAGLAIATLWIPGESLDPAERGRHDPSGTAQMQIEQVITRPVEGPIVFTADRQPLRPVHRRVIQRKSWVDERENIRMEMTVPRDEIVFVTAQAD